MASFSSGGYESEDPEPRIRDSLEALLSLERAKDRWFWRGVGLLVSAATVTSAVFSVLVYLE